MSEFHSSSANKEQPVEDFNRLSSNDWYQTLPEDRGAKQLRLAAKADFMANHDARYPDITYPRLDELDMDTVERHYQRLLADAIEIEDEELSNQAYEPAARKLAELFRHKEVQRRLGWSQDPELSRLRAGAATFELFGEVQRDDFAHLITALRAEASSIEDTSVEAQELLKLTQGITPDTDKPKYELSPRTIEKLRSDIYEIYPGLKDVLDAVPASDASVADKTAFMRSVVACVSSNPAATFEVIPGSKVAASTSAAEAKVSVGEEKLATYSSVQLIKTSVHEAIGHLERANRARMQPDAALRQTFNNNLAFEEGFATAVEQIITGETRIAGEQYYTAVGLQLGLDRDGEQRDFRETYEIMWRRLIVQATIAGKEMTHEEAQEKAYAQVMRTNRGGAVDARDLAYFEGAKRSAWLNAIAEFEPSERRRALCIILSGRFDASDPVQWERFEDAYNSKEKS